MITASTALKTLLEQQSTIIINAGCTVEYNMNTLVDSIVVSGADISRADSAGNVYYPFKKLFPVDTVIKQNRPLGAGIKYAIVGDIGTNTYRNPKSSEYGVSYRTYYPGSESVYKYYVSDKGVGLDVTATYPKTILTNKIVIRFELGHSTPSTWTVYSGSTQLATGTSSDIKAFGNPDAGTVTIYYNGTSWVKTEPASISNPINMTSLRVTTGAVTGKYIGLIEMSPRWIKDVTDRVVDFEITKETSSGSDDILPVGSVTANSLSLSMVSYEDTREVVSFDKTMTFDSTKTYMYKAIEVVPYFKIYHSDGALTDSSGAYDKIKQGLFYVDSFSIEEFGNVSVTALDGARILQQLIAPSIVCKDYTTVAVIRTLLDNIGFTNYNFNITSTDTSIFSPRYWWTDDGGTVWDSIQRLCRDSQMVALFDENNVLQFYTREYLFSTVGKTPIEFRYSASGSNLPNILSFNKQDLPSANQVKVLWKSVTTNNYTGNSQPLWASGERNLGALSLEGDISAISGQTVGPYSVSGTNSYVKLNLVVANDALKSNVLNEYSGYLVIDSEIIEYDAIQYEYTDLSGVRQSKDITSGSEALKYLGLSQPGASNYQPNGKYRIKTRGAFGTKIVAHYKQENILNSWAGYDTVWSEASGSTPVLTNVASVTATVATTQVPTDSPFDADAYIKSLTSQGWTQAEAASSARYAAQAEYWYRTLGIR
jgi:hypothetical protein